MTLLATEKRLGERSRPPCYPCRPHQRPSLSPTCSLLSVETESICHYDSSSLHKVTNTTDLTELFYVYNNKYFYSDYSKS